MAQARLREALNAGGPGSQKEKGPQPVDGILSVTPDTPEALEWRTRRSVIDSAGASSSYLEDDSGPRPTELYGKFTWKIENFSEITKRELRSTVFEVGSYKWYILVYPQGCDVCNHLSLFLCVADYDKLLPGWSHFAQFTIAVVNKDPKKSKYSDTLHRFCKKEHDWGWKKFMELNKVLEGFTVSNTLVIKAQVQVIRDRQHAPFRCLEAQYRRELVRVYLTNVETLARKFVEEKREALAHLREDNSGFRTFWGALDPKKRRDLATASGETILKGIVKRFFNEKEVTSTLVMDALFSGAKQLEEASRLLDAKKAKKERQPVVAVDAEKNTWALHGEVQAVLDRASSESIPPFRDDKANDSLAVRNAQDADDYSSNYVERDERRLAELGRRAVEMYAVAHIFSELDSAYSEAESIKRQDALIKEEEEAERLEDERTAARLAAEREKKARKKERQRAKKAAEQAKKEAEDEERRKLEAIRKAEAAKRAEELAAQRRQEEEQREKERQDALKERAARQAQETARLQEAAEAAAKLRAAEIQERPARPASPDTAATRSGGAGTTGRAGTASRSDLDDAVTTASRNGAVSQSLDSDDLSSTDAPEDATLSTMDDVSLDADTSTEEDEEKAPAAVSEAAQPRERRLPQVERQGSVGPIRGHVEYLQAQLATSNAALAKARSEVAEAEQALSQTRKQLSERTQQLNERTVELNERNQEVASLRTALTELRQQHKALLASATAMDNRSSVSEISNDSRPASRSSSLDMSGVERPHVVQARAAAQAANMKGMTKHASLDSSSDSPRLPLAENGITNSSSGSSTATAAAQRMRSAWNGTAAEQTGPAGPGIQAHRSHSGPSQQQQPPPPAQAQPSQATAAESGPAAGHRGAATQRGGVRGANAVPALPKDTSSAAVAAAAAAAAAALRPTPRSAQGGSSGASGAGRASTGSHGKQPNAGQGHNKNGPKLNGNAAAFVPSSSAALSAANGLPAPAAVPNGVISYRNAAAGSNAASSPRTMRPTMTRQGSHNSHGGPPVKGQQQQGLSNMSHGNSGPPGSAAQNGGNGGGKAQLPAPVSPSAAAAAAATAGNQSLLQHDKSLESAGSNGMIGGGGSSDGSGQYGQAAAAGYGLGRTQSHGPGGPAQPLPGYSTPLVQKRMDPAVPADSPGLDDFAHMGLITDLLE